MIRFSNVALRMGVNLLFESLDTSIHPGQKVGLTGGNGCGKSSLFKLLLGETHADEGDIKIPPEWITAHVAQEMPDTDSAAIDYVMAGDKKVYQLHSYLAQAIESEDGEAQANLHLQLEACKGYDARARAARLMHGLGFAINEDEKPVNTFSGGWRMRLNLARALMCPSDLLLLDEPTNHLDLDAVIWLESWLREYQGTLILISHDRDFLNNVIAHILHIEHKKVTLYTGNYDQFERVRADRLAQQQTAYEKQQAEKQHMESFVERFRAKATKAKQAQSRLKALAKMSDIAPAHIDSPFHFKFPDPGFLPSPLLSLEKVSVGYSEEPLLKGLNLRLQPEDRIGLLGSNGAGKSTLIKLLAGESMMSKGIVTPANDLRIAYFDQHQVKQLDPKASALLHIQRLDSKATEQQLRNFLGGFNFIGDKATDPVAPFSGGEKARLVLAMLVWQRPNLLLLDEPTNHLDIEMRHALSVALQEYAGALMIVSHDRHLLRTVCEQLWLVDAGTMTLFDGDLDSYPEWLAKRRRASATERNSDSQTKENSSDQRKARKREEAELRKQQQPMRNRQKKLERELATLEEKKEALEAELAKPELYEASKKDKLKKLMQQQADNRQKLEMVETEWMEIMESLES